MVMNLMASGKVTRRDEIAALARQYNDPAERARRIFLDEPSYGASQKRGTEFEIKSALATQFAVPFRAVAFCGSAQLGFSAHKGSDFIAGASDLDAAIIDSIAFQRIWQTLVHATKAFTDLSGFDAQRQPDATAVQIRDMMARRGLLHLNQMPRAREFDVSRNFLDQLSVKHRDLFARINVSFYINEYAFCWKQNSALQSLLG